MRCPRCLAGRSALRLGTKFRGACHGLPPGVPWPGFRGSFFKSLLRFRVAIGMLRTHRKAAIAEVRQILADGAFVHLHAQPHFKFLLQIHPPPAHHFMHRRIRPSLHQSRQSFLLAGTERALVSAGPPLAQARNTFGVVVVNPVAQGLPVHAAGLGRGLPVHPFEHQRDRQHPPHDQRVLLLLRKPAQVRRRQIKPGNRHSSRHR